MAGKGLKEADLELVNELRKEVKDILPDNYDTDFNLLRWIKAYGADMPLVKARLRRHLKFRKVADLDNEETPEIIITEFFQKYVPVGIVGPVGKSNKILAFELPGRADADSITQATQTSTFTLHRFRYLNKLHKMIMEAEKRTNEQSGLIYVYDLEGLSMSPFLLPIVTGPLRIMWQNTFDNYPELMYRIIVVNVPTFMNVIWAAFSPFVPEHTKEKIIFTGSNWKDVLLEYVDAECLPVHWGGKMVDSNGDPMCRDRIVIPPGIIPKELYWKPKPGNPTMDDLTPINVSAGAKAYVGYYVTEADTILEWFIHCDQEYTFAIYYSEDPKSRKLSEMEQVFVEWLFPGMPTIDEFRFPCKKTGAYHLKFGNEAAWFLSVTPKYAVRFWDKKGKALEPISLDDNK